MKFYLASKTVAWEIPPGRIARFYAGGLYLPPRGWAVTCKPELGVTCFKNHRKIRAKVGHQASFIS